MGNMGAAPGTWHPGQGPAATTAHTVQGWSLGRREGRDWAWRVEQISRPGPLQRMQLCCLPGSLCPLARVCSWHLLSLSREPHARCPVQGPVPRLSRRQLLVSTSFLH